jgi:hypothetical protein
MTKFFIKDPEAAVYMIESSICLIESLTAANYCQSILDLVGLIGWVKSAF